MNEEHSTVALPTRREQPGSPGVLVHQRGGHDGEQDLCQRCAHVIFAVRLWISTNKGQQREQQLHPDPHCGSHPFCAAWMPHALAGQHMCCARLRLV